jgi:hypothetical protein
MRANMGRIAGNGKSKPGKSRQRCLPPDRGVSGAGVETHPDLTDCNRNVTLNVDRRFPREKYLTQ